MGKYLTVILGLAAMACGAWGIRATWPLLWRAIQAMVPALFFLGGGLAVLVGLGEIRDSFGRDPKTEKPKN
ncbi:MAG: hypothetical protein HY596_03210 [Candidatus Omnitrophica bacterium]|nr:hypothetical protein [Candidatus Omnitrophota bacterium]